VYDRLDMYLGRKFFLKKKEKKKKSQIKELEWST